MDELFLKRMANNKATSIGLGGKLVDDSNIVEDKLFDTSRSYKKGMLYDWNLNEISEVDYRFEKFLITYGDSEEVEYRVQFRPNFQPEYLYKDLYHKKDGRERFGFYLDVPDYEKGTVEKWLIVGKDDRTAFDKYNAYRCNWVFEWVHEGKYMSCLGVYQDAKDASFQGSGNEKLGGTAVGGQYNIILPSNEDVETIDLGYSFIIGDSIKRPRVYFIKNINDLDSFGVTRYYAKRKLFNPHTDFYGVLNEASEYEFVFDTPIDDLPEQYGGAYHAICGCLKGKKQDVITEVVEDWELNTTYKYLYVNGNGAIIEATSPNGVTCEWHILIDGEEYTIDELSDYFDINISNNKMTIKAINKDIAKYIVTIAIYDKYKNYYDSVDLEVKI